MYNERMLKKLLTVNAFLFVIAILFSLTPFYGFSYLILIILGSRIVHFSKFFSSIFSSGILSFLLLTATIMIVGMLAYLAKMPLHAVMCVIAFGLILLGVIYHQRDIPVVKRKFIDRNDWISLCLAFIAPVAIIFNFLMPHPTQAAVYQFLSTGWDNSAHLNIMQGNSQKDGYFYAKQEAKPHNSYERSNAYPQGWHLAVQQMVDGFNLHPLDGKKPLVAMDYYFAVYLFWYVIALYTTMRVTWGLFRALTKNASQQALSTVVFAIASLPVQIIVFYGSLTHGFANYIGMFAYLAVLAAMILEQEKDDQRPRLCYYISLLMAVAVTMTWLLPSPAVALVIFLGLVAPRLKRSSFTSWTTHRKSLVMYSMTLLSIILAAIQVMIYKSFSITQVGQLDVGTTTGTFPISALLVAVTLVTSVLFWIKVRVKNNGFVVIVFPFLFLTLGVYAFQLLSSGTTSYYFGKMLGITLVMTSIFFIPAVTALLLQAKKLYRLPALSTALLAVAMVAVLFMGCEQSTKGLNSLLQRQSKATYHTAQATVDYLKHSDPPHTELVVMRHVKRAEDNNGYMHNLLSNTALTCANYVTGSTNLDVQLRSLKKCAQSLPRTKLTVITSKVTYQKVKVLGMANIKIVNVP